MSDKKLFWYELLHRGIGPGCQPHGVVDWNESEGEFGIVAYDRELTPSEIEDYELRPWSK